MKKRNFLFLLAVLIFASARVPQYEVGDTVRDFKLKNTDGKMVSLSDFKDAKGVIVVFDCNTCPFSKAYNERIMALSKKYKDDGVPLVAINANDPVMSPGDSYDAMIEVAKEKKYDFPYLIDETQQVAKSFGATNTPHVYILKNDGGNFKVVYVGAIDNNAKDEKAVSKRYVEDAVEAIIANKAVPTSKTKAIGCGIKYRNT
jgi:peroxiredoxin